MLGLSFAISALIMAILSLVIAAGLKMKETLEILESAIDHQSDRISDIETKDIPF